MKRSICLIFLFLLAPFGAVGLSQPASAASLNYLSPPDGGRFVPPASTVALRLDGPIEPSSLSPALFTLTGSLSGKHAGQTQLATDGSTVVFKPASPFAAGETVTLAVGSGLKTRSGELFGGLTSSFSVSDQVRNQKAIEQVIAEDWPQPPAGQPAVPSAPGALAQHPQDDVTFPDDFPAYTVTVPGANTAPGLLFMAPIPLGAGPNFVYITDNNGEPVYVNRLPTGDGVYDFKEQPDGSLTYYDFTVQGWHVLDNTYKETRLISAVNGYSADLHDLQILPNGDALFLIYDPHQIDMSQIISGGVATATVIGLVIQEIDPTNLPVFQWSSWDHFLITDTYQSLTTTVIDPVHGNAIERDTDGNLLLSSRHMSEITKIGRDGHIIWRLGGKNNQFIFQPDADGPFSCEHDIRRLPNGDLSMFDNHDDHTQGSCTFNTFSRAVEYQIDETAKVVTNTWQFRNNPDQFGPFTGNNQLLPDGHRLIDWGYSYPNVTEVLTDGTKLFEMQFAQPYFSYRAFRFPWSAVPGFDPTLVLTGTDPTLYYSWNGATDVATYQILGGWGPTPMNLVGTQTRTGFEDHTAVAGLPSQFCSFRVRPVDHEGQPQRFSNVVYTSTPCNEFDRWFPDVFVN